MVDQSDHALSALKEELPEEGLTPAFHCYYHKRLSVSALNRQDGKDVMVRRRCDVRKAKKVGSSKSDIMYQVFHSTIA